MSALAPRLFIAQSTLEAWLDAGVADVEGDTVVLKTLGQTYDIEPAVRIVGTLPDPHGSALLDKIVTEAKLVELGGELMGDSVLFGDQGFSVEPGYVGALAGFAS